MKLDLFSSLLILMVLLGLWWPDLASGTSGSFLQGVTQWGVSLIFLIYGIKLKTKELISGLSKWRLHLMIQACTFILFPLLVFPFIAFDQDAGDSTFWLSIYFLACLPSTVSSSVVMVSIAKGDVPSAIFNASISGILGIVLTPLLLTPFISEVHEGDFTPVLGQLIYEILLPLLIGLALSPYLGKWFRARGGWLTWFDRSIILFIVYKSFAISQLEGHFIQLKGPYIVSVFVAVIVLFIIVYGITNYVSRITHLPRGERITLQYCGSKKSLIHGSIFAQALFGPQAALGLLLLPVLIYHGIQIIVVSWLAQKQNEATPTV
jgi:sodium/bile acid cotransporter 7